MTFLILLFCPLSSCFSLFFSFARTLFKEEIPPLFLSITTVLPCPFDIAQSFSTSWPSYTGCLHSTLSFPCPWPGASHVCKQPWFAWVGNGNKTLSVRCARYHWASLLLGLFVDRARGINEMMNSWCLNSNKKQPKTLIPWFHIYFVIIPR